MKSFKLWYYIYFRIYSSQWDYPIYTAPVESETDTEQEGEEEEADDDMDEEILNDILGATVKCQNQM